MHLFCLTKWDRNIPDCIFPVTVKDSEVSETLVGVLKELVRVKLKVGKDLAEINTRELEVWKLDTPIFVQKPEDVANILKNIPSYARKLNPLEVMSEVFPTPPPLQRLHLIIDFTSSIRKRSRLEFEDDKEFQDDEEAQLCADRLSVANRYEDKAPSAGAVPSEFHKFQTEHPQPRIYCNRPANAYSIPVTLLHDVFGQFIDDCANLSVGPVDHAFVRALLNEMSGFFTFKRTRVDRFIWLLQHHYDIQLFAATIHGTEYRTDGHTLEQAIFPLVITEGEVEVGEAGDPYLQMCLYYEAFSRSGFRLAEEAKEAKGTGASRSCLPCFGICYAGAQISFAGAAYTDRPHVDVLGPILPLYCHPSDEPVRIMIARTFAAFRKAHERLRQHYQGLRASTKLPVYANPRYPYPRDYQPLGMGESTRIPFRYTKHPNPNAWNFWAETIESPTPLFVKFTRRYSVEAHLHCSNKGFAPALHACVLLPGGWKMIVMQRLGPEYIQYNHVERRNDDLRQEVDHIVRNLHVNNLVHGDLRDVNIMVDQHTLHPMLLDFDWAGEIGKAEYPSNVNKTSVHRPAQVVDGALISPDHDLEMLAIMFGL